MKNKMKNLIPFREEREHKTTDSLWQPLTQSRTLNNIPNELIRKEFS